LTFKVTGIDANLGKGALASLIDGRTRTATGAACAATYFKVYGPGPDLGKVKDELFNQCCTDCATCTTDRSGTLGCETWAGEARSSVIFTSTTQTCDIEVRFGGTPNQHSYAISCDDGKGDSGVGDDPYELGVTMVTLLEGEGGYGKIDGATILSEQFCYEAATVVPPADAGVVDGGASSSTLEIPVVEDVTAASTSPTSVSSDVMDLACGDGEELFLKFVVPETVGTVKKATLTLTNAGTPSAEGDGGAIHRVTSNAWSETTLTWSTKPPYDAAVIATIGPVALDQVVAVDVTSAITTRGTYSLAMARSGGNGTHFSSKEVSAARGPRLTIEYVAAAPVVDPKDAGASPPDAGSDAATDAGGDAGTRPDSGVDRDRADDPSDIRGGCAMGARADGSWWLLSLAFAGLALGARRTRRGTLAPGRCRPLGCGSSRAR
jgi:hypothetical protein